MHVWLSPPIQIGLIIEHPFSAQVKVLFRNLVAILPLEL